MSDNVTPLRPPPVGLLSEAQARDRHRRIANELHAPSDVQRVLDDAARYAAFFDGRLDDSEWLALLSADHGEIARGVLDELWTGDRKSDLADRAEALAGLALAFARHVRKDDEAGAA